MSATYQKVAHAHIIAAITQNHSLLKRASAGSRSSSALVKSCVFMIATRRLCVAPKLHGDVGLDYGHAIHLLLPLLLCLHLLVLAEVLDVFGMRQVLLSGILIVVLFPVMDLIFVLVVSVMSRSKPEVGKRQTFGNADSVLCVGNGATAVAVEEPKDLVHSVLLLLRGNVTGRFVLQAVCFEDVVARPLVAAIVVVEVEERTGVERVDVMLL